MNQLPAYRQIETWLREQLPDRKEGDLLPTVAEMCARFNVSGVQTVRNGYQPLVDEGWVAIQERPQRRWIVAKVPPRDATAVETADLVERIEEIEQALHRALRDLGAVKRAVSA